MNSSSVIPVEPILDTEFANNYDFKSDIDPNFFNEYRALKAIKEKPKVGDLTYFETALPSFFKALSKESDELEQNRLMNLVASGTNFNLSDLKKGLKTYIDDRFRSEQDSTKTHSLNEIFNMLVNNEGLENIPKDQYRVFEKEKENFFNLLSKIDRLEQIRITTIVAKYTNLAKTDYMKGLTLFEKSKSDDINIETIQSESDEVFEVDLKEEIRKTPKLLQNVHSTNIQYIRFVKAMAVYKAGTKDEDRIPNPLTFSEQVELIDDIFTNCKLVKTEDGGRIAIYYGGDVVLFAERAIQNFTTLILERFKKITYTSKTDKQTYMCINLNKVFEVLKSTQIYSFVRSVSVFHDKNHMVIDNSSNVPKMTIYTKLNYKSNLGKITNEQYNDVVEGMNKHWQGYIPIILDHMVAGKFTNDKKNLWLAIFANTNFGKSKLFEFMEKQQYLKILEFQDLATTGITNVSPEDVEGKLALVVDEVLSFNRNLFKISDYITMRPMGRHSVNVGVNSRYLLSADGGVFNNAHMEAQIVSRVAILDLRKSNYTRMQDLEITKKHGKAIIEIVMIDYLYNEIQKRFNEYAKLDDIDKINKADNVITKIFEEHKINKPDLFDTINDSLQAIMNDMHNSLDDRTTDELLKAVAVLPDGWLLRRPNTVLNKILINYDESLSYELSFKSVEQIANALDGYSIRTMKIAGKTTRGFFIPKHPEIINVNKDTDLGIPKELEETKMKQMSLDDMNYELNEAFMNEEVITQEPLTKNT